MFKVKPVYEYLGDPDQNLYDRIVARCPTCSPPAVSPNYIIGEAVEAVSSGWLEPKVCKLTSTTFLLVYRNAGATSMAYRIGTVSSSGGTTLGVQGTLVSGSSALGAMSLVYLQDNKALLTYAQGGNSVAVVVNVSGSTATLAGSTTVNTEHQASYLTSPFRTELISALKVLLCFRNSDTGKSSLQVLNISALDVVTYGSVAKSTTMLNTSRPNLCLLSSTAGVGSYTSSTRVLFETFTTSGDTVTWSGVGSANFPNTTQIPGPTTYDVDNQYMCRLSATSVFVALDITTTTPTVNSGQYSFVLSISGSSVSSTTIFEPAGETGTQPLCFTHGGNPLTVYRKLVTGTDYTPRVLYNNPSDPPTSNYEVSTATAKVVNAVEACALSGVLIVIAYEGGAVGTEVSAVGGRVT